MRRLLVAAVTMCGCGGGLVPFMTRPAVPMTGQPTYPHEVEYQLLGQVEGRACATHEEISLHRRTRSADPYAAEPHFLYEKSKFVALSTAKDADGFFSVRTATESGDMVCMTVRGRAYKLVSVKAVAPHGHADGHE